MLHCTVGLYSVEGKKNAYTRRRANRTRGSMKSAAFAAVLLLCGCQFPPPAPPPQTMAEMLAASQAQAQAQAEKQMHRLTSGLQNLRQQNIRVASNLMGYPQSQREALGNILYLWSSSTTLPATQAVGPMTLSCTIEIATDVVGTIISARWWDGGGCNPYANLFPMQ